MTRESPGMRVIFINSHPIQYFVPLYRYLNSVGITTECWYCSDENLHGHFDRQFGTKVTWDIPLLEGYTARFFSNRSWKPSLYNGFWGLINTGIWRALFRQQKSVIVVHGWNYLTHVVTIILGRLAGHRICLRGESPLNQEMMKSPLNRLMKRIFLGSFLFRFVNKFLFIGEENRKFYRYYGVREEELLFTPYAVDNERFQSEALKLRKREVRAQLGLAANAFVVLYTAKFIEKKRPLDLLLAFEKLDVKDKFLVMVGDGELKTSIEQHASLAGLKDKILLPGFVNQADIAQYYKAADVFVLCSGLGETWGLSVNEAMNFNLPVVVSRTAGCSADLVRPGSGYSFDMGNVDQLAVALLKIYSGEQEFDPRAVVSQYSFGQIATSLERIIFTG